MPRNDGNATTQQQRPRGIDRSKVANRAKQRQSGGSSYIVLPDGVEYFAAEKGKALIDILPYEIKVDNHPEVKKGELWYQRTFWIHRDVGPEGKSIICPQKTFGKPCPVCEEYNRLKNSPDADDDTLSALRAKERELFNVIDVESKDQAIQVFEMSFHNFGKLLEEEVNEGGPDVAGFSDLVGGLSIEVRFSEESGGQYKYLEAAKIDFVKRDADYPDSILDEVVNLDTCLKVLPYEEIDRLFHGGAVEDDDGGSPKEETAPPPKTRERIRREVPGDLAPPPAEDKAPRGRSRREATPPVEDAPPAAPAGEECVACEGTGKTSKGNPCRICGGTGYTKAAGTTPPPPPPAAPAPRRERAATPPPPAAGKTDDGWGGDDGWGKE